MIGILGGMGPLATLDIQKKIIENTKAAKDQDHIKTIILIDPKIPNRTEFINGNGADPVPYILDDLKKLESFRVEFLIIACVTAHAFVSKIEPRIKTPILSIVNETINYVRKNFSKKKIGILATSGSVKIGVYSDSLANFGFEIVSPSREIQINVDSAIDDIKKGNSKEAQRKLLDAIDFLISFNHVELIILGCTDIPLVINSKKIKGVDILDINEVIAASVVRKIQNDKIE